MPLRYGRVGDPTPPISGNEADRIVGVDAGDEAGMAGTASARAQDRERADPGAAEPLPMPERRGHDVVAERRTPGAPENEVGEGRAPGTWLTGDVAGTDPPRGLSDDIAGTAAIVRRDPGCERLAPLCKCGNRSAKNQ